MSHEGSLLELENLREAYKASAHKKEILRGVIGQCSYLKFNYEQTTMMIGLVAGFVPLRSEEFSKCPEIPEEEERMVSELIKELKEDDR